MLEVQIVAEPSSRMKGHPVLLRLPQDMAEKLTILARQRSLPLATVARQLVKERLDQIDESQPSHLTAAQLMQRPIEERRQILAAAAAEAADEYHTDRSLTDFEAFGESDLYAESE